MRQRMRGRAWLAAIVLSAVLGGASSQGGHVQETVGQTLQGARPPHAHSARRQARQPAYCGGPFFPRLCQK
jgi:hypothetical protein